MWGMYADIKKEIQAFDVSKMTPANLENLCKLVDIYKDLTEVWQLEVKMEKYKAEMESMGWRDDNKNPEEYIDEVHMKIKKMFEKADPTQKSMIKQKLMAMSQMA